MGRMRILLLALLPIGDTLFATPAIHALRTRYPRARIVAVAYPTNSGILRSNPDIDEIILWPTRQTWQGIGAARRLFAWLRRERFHLAVEFSNYSWWITRLAGIRRRTEMDLPHFWWIVPGAGKKWRQKHAVEHYADVVRKLGIPVTDTCLRIHTTPEEEAKADEWLRKHDVAQGEPVIGMHPGGEGLWGRKRWDVSNFARVADGLVERVGARIMVMGGKDEEDLASELASRTRYPVINAAGQTTLGETAALAARCALFVGNDSSPLHIAAASGTDVVGIYGPTDPRSYHPWVPKDNSRRRNTRYAVVRSSLRCACRFTLVGGITIVTWFTCLLCPALRTISPEKVLAVAVDMLQETTNYKLQMDTNQLIRNS